MANQPHSHPGYAAKSHTHSNLVRLAQAKALIDALKDEFQQLRSDTTDAIQAVRAWANNRFLLKTDYPGMFLSVGSAVLPSLLSGGETTVSVALRTAMADTTFDVVPVLTAPGVGLLTDLQIVSTSVVSASSVNVVVRNTGLVTLSGASVLVLALRSGDRRG